MLDENGKLVGVVTEKSLVYASPTPATTLSVFEVDYILSRTKIGQIVQGTVITVGPDLPIEEAARIMVDQRIGCLPVVEDDKLIGIIAGHWQSATTIDEYIEHRDLIHSYGHPTSTSDIRRLDRDASQSGP